MKDTPCYGKSQTPLAEVNRPNPVFAMRYIKTYLVGFCQLIFIESRENVIERGLAESNGRASDWTVLGYALRGGHCGAMAMEWR